MKSRTTWFMTGFAIAGVCITAIQATKDSAKAEEKVKEIEEESKAELTKKGKFNATWSLYLPSVFWGLLTSTCILSANIINLNNQTALAGAYSIIESSYNSYVNGVKELYGEEAHRKVVSHIVAQRAEQQDIWAQDWCGMSVLDYQDDEDHIPHLYYLECADKFFISTNVKVYEAEYHFNRNFCLGGSQSVAALLDMLGVELTEKERAQYESVGWDMCNGDLYWVDFNNFKSEQIEMTCDECPDGIVRVIQTPYWPTEPYDEMQ